MMKTVKSWHEIEPLESAFPDWSQIPRYDEWVFISSVSLRCSVLHQERICPSTNGSALGGVVPRLPRSVPMAILYGIGCSNGDWQFVFGPANYWDAAWSNSNRWGNNLKNKIQVFLGPFNLSWNPRHGPCQHLGVTSTLTQAIPGASLWRKGRLCGDRPCAISGLNLLHLGRTVRSWKGALWCGVSRAAARNFDNVGRRPGNSWYSWVVAWWHMVAQGFGILVLRVCWRRR